MKNNPQALPEWQEIHDILWKVFRESTKHAANKRHAELGATAICQYLARNREGK